MKSMYSFSHSGNFNNTTKFLNTITRGDYIKNKLDKYAKEGVQILEGATPVLTGKTAASWGYTIEYNDDGARITWTNDNVAKYIPVVMLIVYGHATKGGTYVQPNDFITPNIQPLFDKLSSDVWKEVIDA